MKTGNFGKQSLICTRDKVIKELQSLGAYLYKSANTGSQYIKFTDPRIGSLRIGDHKGKTLYKYKWNLIAGRKNSARIITGRSFRQYCPIEKYEDICSEIRVHSRELLEQYGEYDITRDRFSISRTRNTRLSK